MMQFSINLASRAFINKKALYLGYVACAIILLIGLLSNAGYYARLHNQIKTTNDRLVELEEKIIASQGGDATGYSAARYEQVVSEIAVANEILHRDTFRWTSLLDKLERVVPGNVRILNIAPDHKTGSIKVTALAKGVDAMKRFLDNLIESDDYENVFLFDQAETKTVSGIPAISFSIELLGVL
ncbi:MAG: hypothetical protein C0615_00865 [Desulfuromonas sp.]|nr:MAG: hypothetical protein C0615_00865 [Desulfuromonas sp.]